MSFENLNLEIDGKGEKIKKEESLSKERELLNIQDNFSKIGKEEKINFSEEQKEDLQKDVSSFLQKAANNELGNHLSEFNSDNFDKDGENGEKNGLDKFEFENFTKTLDSAIDQIILLEGMKEFSEIHEESADYSMGWNNFDKSISEKIDFQELILGEEGGEMAGEKLIKALGGFSDEEIQKMGNKDFNSLSSDSWGELGILLAKELGDGVEGGLRFVGNVPAAAILIPRYLNYRVDINSDNLKERTEGEIKIKELVEENPALAILDLLGEKGVEMLKELGKMILSKENTQGEIAVAVGMIVEILVGAKGSQLSGKFTLKGGKEIGNKIETHNLKKEGLSQKPFIEKMSKKIDDVKNENLDAMNNEVQKNGSGIKNFDEESYKNVFFNKELTGLRNRTSLTAEISDVIAEKGSVIIVKSDIDNLGPTNNGWVKKLDKMVDKEIIDEKDKFVIGDFLIAKKAQSFREIGNHCEDKFPGLRFRNFQEGGDEFASVINTSNLKKDLDGNILDKDGNKFSKEDFQEYITEKYREKAKKIQDELFEILPSEKIKNIKKDIIKKKGQPKEPGLFGKKIDVQNQFGVSSASVQGFDFSDFKISEKMKNFYLKNENYSESDLYHNLSKTTLAMTDEAMESTKNKGVDGYKRNMILNANTGNLKINGKINHNTGNKISQKNSAEEINHFKLDNEISDLKNQELSDELLKFSEIAKIRENNSLKDFNKLLEKCKNQENKLLIENFARKGEFSEKAFQNTFAKLKDSNFKNVDDFKNEFNDVYQNFIKGKIEKGHYSSVRNNFDDLKDNGIIKKEDIIDIEINHAKPINELLGHIMLDKIITAKEIIFQKGIEKFVKENFPENIQKIEGEEIIFQMSKGPKTGFAFNKKLLEKNGISKKEIKNLEEKFTKESINFGNNGLENIRKILGQDFNEKVLDFIKKNQSDKISSQKDFYEIYKNGQIKKNIFSEILKFSHIEKK